MTIYPRFFRQDTLDQASVFEPGDNTNMDEIRRSGNRATTIAHEVKTPIDAFQSRMT
jgi:hypothetical protein